MLEKLKTEPKPTPDKQTSGNTHHLPRSKNTETDRASESEVPGKAPSEPRDAGLSAQRSAINTNSKIDAGNNQKSMSTSQQIYDK